MWIVRLALRRPYTFAVLALLIVLVGVGTILRIAKDIFPVIDIPVVTVIWSYAGVTPQDMERRFVTVSERAYTTSVGDIEHIESQSMNGIGVIRIFFQPGANVPQGIAQIAATSQSLIRGLPPGTTPPLILRYDASDVPVLQASLNSPTLSEQDLYDYGQNFIRTQLATIQGASVPLPYGGKQRQVMVDLDPPQLYAKGLSPLDVSNAINAQNLILPTGDAKIGDRDYTVLLNGSPATVGALNDLPVKQVNGATVYIRDVANVRDGFAVQQNLVNQDGKRAALLTVLKSGGASTLDVVQRVKAALPHIKATLPQDLHINLLADQSQFVKGAIGGVVREAAIAACLTALMILLFLGSLRSTLIVAVSIPLSILTSIIVLGAIGQTLNIMTLGGLALAVGILVDDTTVTIENINRYLAQGESLKKAILDGSAEIALPALVSTLSICIVFVPVAFLTGAARSLFLPLALAVIFAMLASYLLSRTLTPTMTAFLLRREVGLYREGEDPPPPPAGRVPGSPGGRGRDKELDEDRERVEKQKRGIVWRTHQKFNGWFERQRERYRDNLTWVMGHRLAVSVVFVLFCALSFALFPFVGRDFFPAVDAGQFRLHVRVPPGTRLEDTTRIFGQVDAAIRKTVPASEVGLVLDNIGLPSSVNLAFSDSATVGPSDGEILVSLRPKHHPVQDYVKTLRRTLPRQFPDDTFFFQPGDIVSQILNFGLPSPIDIQIAGPPRNQQADYAAIRQIQQKVAAIPGAADVHLQQIVDYPALNVNVDRTRAQQVGVAQRDVASDLLVSLSGSGQAAPNFWLNPQNGVNYQIVTQTPQYRIDSIDALLATPLSVAGQPNPQLLGNVATVSRGTAMAVINHYNVQPVYDVYANTQDRDLGGVDGDIQRALKPIEKHLPRGSTVTVRGQVQSMNESFTGLGLGILGAVVLVYLLLAVNFQSWLDPLVVISGAPGALSGILWILFVTQTTISVPALMGAIMCIGVSTANSVLVVTFANERRAEGMDAVQAAIDAGYTRLRPVIMTALAMVIGMIPMALALGEGGEQNAPLGRAVIGGLLVATFTTLFIVPITYTALRKKQPEPNEYEDADDEDETPARAARRRHATNGRNGQGRNGASGHHAGSAAPSANPARN